MRLWVEFDNEFSNRYEDLKDHSKIIYLEHAAWYLICIARYKTMSSHGKI